MGVRRWIISGSLALPGLPPRLGLARPRLPRLLGLRLPRLGWLRLPRLRGGLPGWAGLSSLGTRHGLPLRGLPGGGATCLRGLRLPRFGWLRLPRLGCGWILTGLTGLWLRVLVGLGLARGWVLRLCGTLTVWAGCRLFTAWRALGGLARAGCILGLSLARGLARATLRFLSLRAFGPFRRPGSFRALLLVLRRTFGRQGLSGLWAGIGLSRTGRAARLW